LEPTERGVLTLAIAIRQFPGGLTIYPVWRNKGNQIDNSGLSEKTGEFADPTYIFSTIIGKKAQILVKAVTDIVAVKNIRKKAPFM